MKKINLCMMLLLLLLVASCKPAPTASAVPIASAASSPDTSVESQVKNIKNEIISSPSVKAVSNATKQAANGISENVLAPSIQPQSEENININYKSECWVRNWKMIGVYCSGKDFWHNQSTLLSWYISYGLVLFLLFIAIIVIWRMLKKSSGG